jgi:quinol monooxygenase YgiN
MINVLAAIRIKPGKRDEFVQIFKTNVPNVLAERGCIEYAPNIDVDADLAPQVLDENVVTIVEKWESLEALRGHLVAPHMAAYKEQVVDIVEGVEIKVLEPA